MRISEEVKKEIKLVPSEETWELRQKILRPSQTLENCKFNCDSDPSCFHLALKIHNHTVTVAFSGVMRVFELFPSIRS